MTTTKRIEVWLDTTSEPGVASYVVSLEHCDPEGEPAATESIWWSPDRQAAIVRATREAAHRHLGLHITC